MFDNACLKKRTNCLGCVLSLEPALAKFTWRGVDLKSYWFVNYALTTQPYEPTRENIFHLMEPDINQEIYGLPCFLSVIPSTLSTSPQLCTVGNITSTVIMRVSSCI